VNDQPVERGDAFVLGDYNGFGVVLHVNPARDRGLVLMQSGRLGECDLATLAHGRAIAGALLVRESEAA
jgi:hypothetical protein